MKKLLPFLTILIIISVIVLIFFSISKEKNMIVIYENNSSFKPVDIKLNHFQDTQCGMTISEKKNSVQAISPSGKTWFFDDVGCFALWYKNISFKQKAIIWVYTNDTHRYIDGKKAFYSRIDKTPMNYGFGAYENNQKDFIDFSTMIKFMLRGENLSNPYTKQELLGK